MTALQQITSSPPLCAFTAPPFITRLAREDEAATVLALFIDNLWAIAQFPPDMMAVGREIYAAITDGRVFVVERDGTVVGCAAYAICRPWYVAKPQMWDQGIFVVPAWRKTRAAFLLMKALETEAERLDMPLIFSANTRNEAAAPIMAKRHRKIAEVFVVRE